MQPRCTSTGVFYVVRCNHMALDNKLVGFLKSRFLCVSVPIVPPFALPPCVRCPLLSGLVNLVLVLVGPNLRIFLTALRPQIAAENEWSKRD